MEPIARFEIKFYDYQISTARRAEVLYSDDPQEVLDYVDAAVEGTMKMFGKQFNRVVVYDRILKRNILDYMTDFGMLSENA